MYTQVYQHYRANSNSCFEIIVEDAADDFQKVQDIVNAKVLLEVYTKHNRQVPNVIRTVEEVDWMQLAVPDARGVS